MPVRSLEELAAEIRAAWADAVRPPDNEICNAAFDEGVSAYFAGRPWHGHDVHSLRWHLIEVPALRSLQLQSIPIGNAGLLHLVSCKELVTLRLIGAKVTSTALDAFRRMHSALEISSL